MATNRFIGMPPYTSSDGYPTRARLLGPNWLATDRVPLYKIRDQAGSQGRLVGPQRASELDYTCRAAPLGLCSSPS
jgi:hypothetical protein